MSQDFGMRTPGTGPGSVDSPVSRRRVVAVPIALIIGSAGCSLPSGQSKGASDVEIWNNTPDSRSVTTTIWHADTEDEPPLLQTTTELPANATASPTSLESEGVPRQADYEVDISTDDGYQAIYSWTDVQAQLHVTILTDHIDVHTGERPPESWPDS